MSDLSLKPTSFDTALLGLKAQPQAQKLVETAKDFESVFVSQMLSHMFEGLEPDPLFGGGHGEEMFRSFMVQEYGKMIANGPGIGVSDQIQKMMIQMQQKENGV